MSDRSDIKDPPLSGAKRRELRGLAHDLDPIVQLGQRGLSPAVLAEIDRALDGHELIKVRLLGAREEKVEQARTIERELNATAIQRIGHLVVLYRPNPEAASDETD